MSSVSDEELCLLSYLFKTWMIFKKTYKTCFINAIKLESAAFDKKRDTAL